MDICFNCGTSEMADSRKYDRERYCKKCYKKVSKEKRELMSLATG